MFLSQFKSWAVTVDRPTWVLAPLEVLLLLILLIFLSSSPSLVKSPTHFKGLTFDKSCNLLCPECANNFSQTFAVAHSDIIYDDSIFLMDILLIDLNQTCTAIRQQYSLQGETQKNQAHTLAKWEFKGTKEEVTQSRKEMEERWTPSITWNYEKYNDGCLPADNQQANSKRTHFSELIAQNWWYQHVLLQKRHRN